jgi:hypothetical protein
LLSPLAIFHTLPSSLPQLPTSSAPPSPFSLPLSIFSTPLRQFLCPFLRHCLRPFLRAIVLLPPIKESACPVTMLCACHAYVHSMPVVLLLPAH